MDPSRIPGKVLKTLLVRLLPDPMQKRFVELVLSVAERGEMSAGDVLFKQGDTNTDQGCLILEGAVKVTRADGEVRYLEGPDILGEVQLFTPQAERTATIEVVFGGTMLTFRWHDLGVKAQAEFSEEELSQLREIIRHSATMRERNILGETPDP